MPAQVAKGTYDRDANLALLRLYNFEPELVHVQTVANVLIMALMQLPESDFTLLLHLIPENIQVSSDGGEWRSHAVVRQGQETAA